MYARRHGVFAIRLQIQSKIHTSVLYMLGSCLYRYIETTQHKTILKESVNTYKVNALRMLHFSAVSIERYFSAPGHQVQERKHPSSLKIRVPTPLATDIPYLSAPPPPLKQTSYFSRLHHTNLYTTRWTTTKYIFLHTTDDCHELSRKRSPSRRRTKTNRALLVGLRVNVSQRVRADTKQRPPPNLPLHRQVQTAHRARYL